jgi:hypothetical protein
MKITVDDIQKTYTVKVPAGPGLFKDLRFSFELVDNMIEMHGFKDYRAVLENLVATYDALYGLYK